LEGLLAVIAILLALILVRLLNKDGVTYIFGCFGFLAMLAIAVAIGLGAWAFAEPYVSSNVIRAVLGVALGLLSLRVTGKAVEFSLYLLAPDFMARNAEREAKRAALKLKIERDREALSREDQN
jgi:urea transporter